MYHDTSLSSDPRLPAVPATAGENGSFGSYPDTRYELEKMLFSFSVLAITINNNQETPTWSTAGHWSHCYMASVRGYRMVARGGQGRVDSGLRVDINTVDI